MQMATERAGEALEDVGHHVLLARIVRDDGGPVGGEDRSLGRIEPGVGVAHRVDDLRLRIIGRQLAPVGGTGIVDRRAIVGEDRIPIGPAPRRFDPQRHAFAVSEHLDHVMAWPQTEHVERGLQRLRPRPAKPRADYLERHPALPIPQTIIPSNRGPAAYQSAKGSRTNIVSLRSVLVETNATGHRISSSMRRIYLTAAAGSSAQPRAPAVDSDQPAIVS